MRKAYCSENSFLKSVSKHKNDKKDFNVWWLGQSGFLIQWNGKAIHQWEHLGFNLHLPKSEAFFKECIMIPINMFISNEDLDYICKKIIEFYRK